MAAGVLAVAWAVSARPAPVAAGEIREPVDRVVVEVLNGSGQSGLARRVTRMLRAKGVDVIFFGTAEARVDSTSVLVRRGPMAQGHSVLRALGHGTVREDPDTLLRVDVTVILGRDYRLPRDAPPL